MIAPVAGDVDAVILPECAVDTVSIPALEATLAATARRS
jgi:hypothetical protein